MKNYYDILGINKGATQDEIKSAFRKLAHTYHPDKKGGDEAKFKEVSEAYAVLSDAKKRAQYDQFGSYQAGNDGHGGAGFQGGFGGFDFSQFTQGGFNFNGQNVEFDLGDIFGEMFGGGSQRQQRGRDVAIDIELTFKESILGTERRILTTLQTTCKTCDGSGAASGSKTIECKTCNGKGEIHENRSTIFGTFASTRVCPTCHGTRKVPENPCGTCRGAGVARQQQEIFVKVPAGVSDGEMIRMPGKGEVETGGGAGDLYVKIHVKSDSTYSREGNNIIMERHIKLSDALLGVTLSFATIDGNETLNIPAGVDHGHVFRIKGKGVPQGRMRGDLLVRISIDMPKKLSRSARSAVETLRTEGL